MPPNLAAKFRSRSSAKQFSNQRSFLSNNFSSSCHFHVTLATSTSASLRSSFTWKKSASNLAKMLTILHLSIHTVGNSTCFFSSLTNPSDKCDASFFRQVSSVRLGAVERAAAYSSPPHVNLRCGVEQARRDGGSSLLVAIQINRGRTTGF